MNRYDLFSHDGDDEDFDVVVVDDNDDDDDDDDDDITPYNTTPHYDPKYEI